MQTRTEQPKNNKYYMRKASGGYSSAIKGEPTIKTADVLCNCVGYAGSRFNEIIGKNREVYQLVCNAENFIEAAKRQGLSISDVPIQGGIMVWQRGATLGGGDGAGHVAVVEEIYDDGSILTSESGWNAWAFKNIRRNNDNGRWGQNSAYKFRGCIVNPAVTDPQILPTPKLVVDGIAGESTIRALQKFLATPQDGVISGQTKSLNKYYPGIIAVEYGKGGSACVKALQKWLGITADGIWGQGTSKALQKKLGVTADGIFGKNSVKALQKFLNEKLYAENKEPTGPPSVIEPTVPSKPVETPTADKYKVIDVSVWQGKIDWAKVKADGVVGAIIRYADGDMLDSRFDENMKNAKANGLHIGSYIFSRAKTKAQAEKEAERLFNACKPYGCDMPLYIDLEVAANSKYANTVAQAFLNKMAKLGGKGGVYANLNWWNNYLVDTAKNYSASAFWIAQYYDKITHKNPKLFGMWQYSSSGKVDGISGKVDMDWCYVAYWEKTSPSNPPPTDNKPTETPTTNTPIIDKVDNLMGVAREVIAGDWGSGEKRKIALEQAGYNYDAVQREVDRLLCCRELIIDNIKAWATKIANTHKYKYIYYSEPYGHECAVCHPHNGKNKGWQCIGWVMACWHHGGLPIPCNCGVIDNGTAEKMLKAKTDAEALKIAQQHLKLKDIKVIRNGGKVIPKEQTRPGDIGVLFKGNAFEHMFLVMSDDYISDSTTAGGYTNDISVKRKFAGRYVSKLKMLIRYTGNGFTTPEKKSIDELAYEVIAGMWGSGTSRKIALAECGYDYDKVQARVNELLGLEKTSYPGELPSLVLKKANAEVKADACRWAKWIATDNSFHYGYTNKHGSSDPKKWNPNAHHNGCYFCGTNTDKGGRSKAGIVDYKKTYCCNPFVGAAWGHGGCVPKALELCQNGSSWDYHKGKGYDASSLFDKLGKPNKASLEIGDVLCSDNHVALYVGDGKIAEAAGGDDNVRNSTKWNNSIHVVTLSDAKYKKFKRVYRYNSSVNTTAYIYFGEISKRVELLQKYMQWFGYALETDGIYGEKTHACVKDMQAKLGVTADGIIGNATLDAMAKVVK